ncbi:MAG: metal-dependent transcriptional regulator [Oscillospiraceae bacterium]|nr:metal-dependent transcriptional regulator [Oscillospiraceae bacterium]
MKIYESAEDYLEKILMLSERNGEVRSIDIANEMGVSKPSVSIAMKNLRQSGYISMDSSGYITLEPPGLEIAARIYGRHKKLTSFFEALGVDPAVASHDACKIEHDLSPETFEKLIAFAESHHMMGE